ncbi:MAG: hypothetical protein JXB07_13270 [Anaerolineae bacterium]|nr:hypothetical protein [Anaerolineae bacterium]
MNKGRFVIRKRLFLASIVLLVVLACNNPFAGGGPLSVQITAPAAGSTVAIDQPVTIVCAAQDATGSGVTRVDLLVNGVLIATQQVSGDAQAIFDTSFTWQPTAEGATQLMAIAYRSDGTASSPANISITVVGMTSAAGAAVEETDIAETAQAPSDAATQESYVQGEVTVKSSIRNKPGVLCQIIGVAEKGDVINLMEYSKNKLWLKTDLLGPEEIGWIYIESVKILGNKDDIPHGDEVGCAGCGDDFCGSDETCASCPEDCGECCGNGVCDGDFGENCYTCATDCGQCCGNGVCDPVFGETCSNCEADCGPCPPVCGNGVVETGEQCESNSQCPRRGQTCVNCQCVANHCGNGTCEPGLGEDSSTCPQDCGPH